MEDGNGEVGGLVVRWFLYYYGSLNNTVTTIAGTSGRYFAVAILSFPIIYRCESVCVCQPEGKRETHYIPGVYEAVELSTLAHKF